MEFFSQNGEMTIPAISPLVAENIFFTKTPDTDPFPVFE